MGGIRVVDIVVGYETSTQPTSVTPSVDADVVTKGYADDTYTPYASVGANVADITALKAVASADRYDEQLRFVNGLDLFYQFDADSTATPDDDLVVQPTSGTGRWLKIEVGSGSAAGASNIESALQKLGNEKYGIFSEDLDNAIHESGVRTPVQKLFVQRLMKNYAASDASIEMWHNPTVPWAADPALDSTTGWTVTGAGATLTATNTVGEFQLGTHGLKFDKNGTGTAAGIRYDLGAQTFSAYQNYRVWFKVNMPSVTDLVSIKLRLYADTTSNFSTYTFLLANGQYNGSAITTGWNTFLQDVSASGTSGGTGWLYTQLLRYAEVEVVTGSAGQTYTGVILDSFGFSYGRPEELGVIGDKFTLYNNSTHDGITVDTTNTLYDGPLLLAASVANSYVGTVGASRAAIERSKVLIQDGLMSMDRDSGLSGTITTSQQIRLQKILRESVSSGYKVAADIVTPQTYKITAVGGGSLDLEDPADTTANLVNTNVLHVFKTYYSQGIKSFAYLGDMTVTSSSHSSGTTTANGTPPGSVSVGDYAVKKHLSSSKLSVVSTPTTEENFASLTPDASPNGIILLSRGIPYPNPQYVWAHYSLGGLSSVSATRNLYGATSSLTANGSLNFGDSFLNEKLAASGFSSSNYFSLPAADSEPISGDSGDVSLLQFSLWIYFNGTYGADRTIASRVDGSGNNGWTTYIPSGGNTVTLFWAIGGSSATLSSTALSVGWNNFILVLQEGSPSYMYVNAVKSSIAAAPGIGDPGAAFFIGNSIATTTPSVNMRKSEMIIWRNGPVLTQSQVQNIASKSLAGLVGIGNSQIRYLYTANGQSGQKVSFEGELSATTTAITPAFYNIAVIQS